MNYNWTITKLRTIDTDDKQKVVQSIEWRCTEASSGQFSEGDELIEFSKDSNFVAFENLTQEQVFSWVESKIDKEEIETNLQIRIEMLAAEKEKLSTTNTLPWNN